MKNKRNINPALWILATLSLIAFSLIACSSKVECYDGNVQVWLRFSLREYRSDNPLNNVSVSIKISTPKGRFELGPYVSNETGIIVVPLGEFSAKDLSTPLRLTDLVLSGDYIPIKVNNVFLEDIPFSAQYKSRQVEFSNMQITVEHEFFERTAVVNVDCWALRGKLVSISDCDPITGERSVIGIKMAAKAVPEDEVKRDVYESLYFIPVGYSTLIYHAPKTRVEYVYPNLKIVVDENTSSLNWMYHAAKSYGNYRMGLVDREINWLKSAGLSLDREIEEKSALESLLDRILSLYEKEDYSTALSGIRLFINRINDLEKWLSNLKTFSLASTICISLFVFGLSSILSGFIFNEPSKNKERAAMKAALFTSLLAFFFLTDPSSRITCAILVESAFSSPLPEINVPTILLGLFVIGVLIYFLATVISIKRSPVTDLALQLGVRSLKRRPLRTLLTLITIVIIVSSAIAFVNISAARETRVKGSWPSTNVLGLKISVDPVTPAGLSSHDVEWIEEQEWCDEVTYVERVKAYEPLGETYISRVVLFSFGAENPRIASLICVDPIFMEKHYNFSRYIRGLWKDFSRGEKVALLPARYDVAIGDYVMLSVEETLMTPFGAVPLGSRDLGRFRVVGKFEPAQLSDFKGIDGSPLFTELLNAVLLPVNSIEDPSMAISEVTVIVKSGFDPLEAARELAYLLGLPVVANKNGLAILVRWGLEISSTGVLQYIVPLLVAGLMMYITALSIFEERKRDLFTLATLGLDPQNVLLTFLVETLLMGLLGTFIGFFGTHILSTILSLIPPLKMGIPYNPFSFFVALLVGVATVFLGGYLPSVKAQGLSLMGRPKTRELLGEIIVEGDNAVFQLPIRETLQSSELLYDYSREILRKVPSSLVDPHSIKSEIYGDGSFNISFVVLSGSQSVFIPCNLKGERNEDVLTLSIIFPKSFMEYERIKRILRDLEAHMIGFSSWRDMQLRMRIVREAPKKQKTMDEILDEMKLLIKEIKDLNRKIGILEAQKGKLTEEIYREYRQKYLNMINEKFKALRSTSVGLEPYLSQIQEEIRRTNLEIERVTIAYNLGEISEEDYIKMCSPLQNNLAALKNRLSEVEEILEFLRKPLGIF
ncbi:MAG: FtsX-like permease family protein [Candidatus Bathyarchaeia archaeon]